MNQRADLMQKIQRAGSLQEQAALIAELDRFDRGNADAEASSRSLDFTASLVDATLSPVAVHERSTIETDWLGEISTTAAADASREITAEAAMWYRRLSPEVIADNDEFREQQIGMARRTASAYGEQAPALTQEFVQYTSFLRQREAASGLDQVEQEVDSFENPKPTPLPEQVFDNFAPPIHPINEGVSGTETSERAPLLQEIEAEGNGGGTETHHDTAPEITWSGITPTGATLFDPTVAINHVATLDDFREGGQYHEAASGLPQVEQVVDSFENPAPQPLPTDVAYPWVISEDEGGQAQSEDKEQQSGSGHSASLDPAAVQRRAAYVAGLAMLDPADLSPTERQEVLAFSAALQKRADQWTQGGEQYKGPSAQNSPDTTPESSAGTFQEGRAEGASDRLNDEAPTFADNSSSIPPFAQGHAIGYQEAPSGVVPGQMPPGAGGMQQGYQTHAASLKVTAGYDCPSCTHKGTMKPNEFHSGNSTCTNCGHTASDSISFDKQAGNSVTCDSCGTSGPRGTMTQRGNGHTVETLCTNCKPVPTDESKVRWQGSLKQVSAAFTAQVDQADPEFAKAYKYASRWKPGKRLVTTGSAAFEAGLYAGISDNPENQDAWTSEHRRVARAHKKPEMLQRLSKHRAFSKKTAKVLDLRVVGNYLQPTEEAMAKTAATSTDLDTMAPSASPSPAGTTPINGPGTPPILQGGTDPAAAGGPSPYNGAPPYGQPVVPSAASMHGTPTAIDDTPGGPIDQAAMQHLGPQALAFRKTVQANLVRKDGN